MMKKFLVPHRPTREVLLQKRAKLPRLALLGFSRRQVRQRRFKLSEIVTSQLAVDPRGPFFFKRFHRGPSGGFGVFYGRKKVAPSPSRWNTRALRRSRGIACPRFPSSKSPRDARAKAARSRRRSAPGFPGVPSVYAAARPLSAPSAQLARFPSTGSRRRTPRRSLSLVFSAA